MSGGEDDACRCLFDHEAAMRRLLALLRQSQQECNDSECLTDGLPSGSANNPLIMWSLLWGLMALGLYYLRPNSMRQGRRNNEELLEKPSTSDGRRGNGDDDDNNQPPPVL